MLQYEANTFYGPYRSGAAPIRRITCYFVGAFLCAIFDLLLIIFLGTTAFELQPLVGCALIRLSSVLHGCASESCVHATIFTKRWCCDE